MRSKEVEEAIKRIRQLYNGISVGIILNVKSDGTTCKSLETVLAYIEKIEENENRLSAKLVKRERQIEELEQLPNKIRDKIKKLEENRDKYVAEGKFGSYIKVESKIEVLKSIIGE